MKRIAIILTIKILFATAASANTIFAKWDSNELLLNNGIVQRNIKLPNKSGGFFTTKYKPVGGDFKYFEQVCPEFSFVFNGVTYAGNNNWSINSIQPIEDANEGNGAAVTLASADKKLEITIRYLLYPNSPAIRKNIMVKNIGRDEAALESVDIEKFSITQYFAPTFSWIFSDYGRRRSIGPFEGGIQDALVIVHNPDWQQGIVIGNEAFGVMKRTSVFWDGLEICSGLTHKNNAYPFLKWIKPGQSFETPQVFTMVYNNHQQAGEVLNTIVPDFVRNYMGISLSQMKEKPCFVYNTWTPFGPNINEKLMMELAKAAADAGVKEFVIDDGWQDVYGDWGVDKTKFPNGLKPVFDYVKKLGMRPGLWVSVGTASPQSKVYSQHPDWFVKNKQGKPYSMVIDDGKSDKYTACFGTGWKTYIKNVLAKLVAENGLDYLKLDFSVVTSPYRYRHEESGCYAKSHEGHKDFRESLYTNYEPLWQLFDSLKQTKPTLFIDCTFETLGGLQTIDYAMLKHADGDWLSNFNEQDEAADLRIREMAWWRSPAMPATALVIGNAKVDDKGWENHLKSLAGALPIMLGDPRKISDTASKIYRAYSNWLQLVQLKYDITSYRQDLLGFDEPKEGGWDGFQRINTNTKKGGIAAVLRQGALETQRQVFIDYLLPEKNYQVKSMDGKLIITATGQALKTKGFAVNLANEYDGILFEIESL